MLWPGFCTKDIDTDVDRRTDAQWIYEYDNDGNAIHLTVGPSISGYQYRWKYDSAGNRIVEEFDDGQDGTLDSITTRTYNDLGELISQELDEDGDGSVDVRDQYVSVRLTASFQADHRRALRASRRRRHGESEPRGLGQAG